MEVKIINKSHHPLPGYATPLSAGMDIRANLAEPVVLKPLERKLINLSSEPFTINDGERICQMVITAHSQVVWQPVEVLDDTERGAGGFGHTGK